MKAGISLLVAMLLLAGQAQARLGETLEQCIQRYGPVVERFSAPLESSDQNACLFASGGVLLTIEFKDSVAWHIQYRIDKIIPSDIDTLLQANLPEGESWSAPFHLQDDNHYITSGRDRVASISGGRTGVVDMTTAAYRSAKRKAYLDRIDYSIAHPESVPSNQRLKGF